MPLLLPSYPSVRTRRKPDAPAVLDRAHPLARGLAFAAFPAPGGVVRELAAHHHLTPHGHPVGTASRYGPTLAFGGSSQYLASGPFAYGSPDPNKVTIVALIRTTDLSTRQTIISPNNILGGVQLEIGSSDNPGLGTGVVSAIISGQFMARAVGALPDKDWHILTYVRRNDEFGHEIWSDGVSQTVSSIHSDDYVDVNATHLIGDRSSSTHQYFKGAIAAVSVYNRDLSAGEIGWLTDDPFAMLRPSDAQFWMTLPAVGGGTTIEGTATIAAIASISGAATVVSQGSATLNAAASVSATGQSIATGAATLAASATVSARGTVTALGSATLAAVVSINASGTVSALGRATLSSLTSINARGVVTALGRAVLNAVANIIASGFSQQPETRGVMALSVEAASMTLAASSATATLAVSSASIDLTVEG